VTRIGILGGTLDPIHCGHVAAAIAARDAFDLAEVLIVPSHVPPHRSTEPVASAFHRFAMAALAVSGEARLAASDMELRAGGPSYTADTLDRVHARGFTASQIFFITGVDAFADIATWRRYPEVLDLATFVVSSRPGYRLEMLKDKLPALAVRMGTSVHVLETRTPDVSSTMIRERLRRGDAITGLVPTLVETHIHQHRLYSTSADATVDKSANQLHGEN
jgi:nicotinate-nucleotide adenylyltransferase